MRSVLVMTTVMATLCLGLAATAAAQDPKVTKGQQLFADQKCTLCHSIADKGNKKGPLDGVGAKLSADEIRSWITDPKGMTAKTKATRKPEMKQYTLPKDDVDALVAYLSTVKK
jgi:cytochrome c2